MISKDEIEAKAHEFGIHVSNVERDYVFGWVLVGIYSGDLGQRLILKGGNCFRKIYFPETRFSNDLDFSVDGPIEQRYLAEALDKVCDFVQAASGVVFEKDRNVVEEKAAASDKKIYEARLYFQDFYGNPHTIKISVRLDVTQFDRIYLPVQTKPLLHPYSDGGVCTVAVKCHSLEELLASKLKCLLQRRHSSDLYDYVHWVLFGGGIEVDRLVIARVFLKKTIFERSPGVVKGVLLSLPLAALSSVWRKFIVCPRQTLVEFETAFEKFKEIVESQFGHFITDFRGAVAFFPPHLRNPIIEAASERRCVEMVYDGRSRVIEPYSLTFKRRRDGLEREYFFGYDRTGGRSSGEGLKSFVHAKIGGLKIIDQTYEPRFPVELSKAGEFIGQLHFSSRGGRPRPFSPRGDLHIVECPFCGKNFPRKKYSSSLRRHKDKWGNPCSGRSGYFVY